ncbi:hypothetical protein J7J45_03000, partial [Candidatus Aerophobetes bacterium]|nr:hypothetical protein [Candidatus Aerophobetes bacterium]
RANFSARQKEASLGIPRSPLDQTHQMDEMDETDQIDEIDEKDSTDVFQGSPEIFPETGTYKLDKIPSSTMLKLIN